MCICVQEYVCVCLLLYAYVCVCMLSIDLKWISMHIGRIDKKGQDYDSSAIIILAFLISIS